MLDALPPPQRVPHSPVPSAPIALFIAGNYAAESMPSGLNTPTVAVGKQRTRFGERARSVVEKGSRGDKHAPSVYTGNGQYMHPLTLPNKPDGVSGNGREVKEGDDLDVGDQISAKSKDRVLGRRVFDARNFKTVVDARKTLLHSNNPSALKDAQWVVDHADAGRIFPRHAAAKSEAKALAQRRKNGVVIKEGETIVQETTAPQDSLADVERMTADMIAEFAQRTDNVLKEGVYWDWITDQPSSAQEAADRTWANSVRSKEMLLRRQAQDDMDWVNQQKQLATDYLNKPIILERMERQKNLHAALAARRAPDDLYRAKFICMLQN